MAPEEQTEFQPVESTAAPALVQVQEEASERDSVFISYAHADQKETRWHEKLELFLQGIESVGPRRVWQDGRIDAGSEWKSEIEQALKKTKVAVLLVGPHFLVSDFVRNQEFAPLLEAAKTDGVRIFPFATHYALYGRSFLGKFQFFGDPDEPLESQAPAKRNKSMVELARAIAEVFES